MCLSPTTGRSSVGGGERCDDGDSNEGGSVNYGYLIGDMSGHCRDDGSGGSSGVVLNNSPTLRISQMNRQLSTSVIDDDGIINNQIFRKTGDNNRTKQHGGIRKLQKCLSTAVTNYETDIATTGCHSTYGQHLLAGHDLRNNTTTTTQASLTSQSILTSVRQYSSFGSILI